MIERREFGKTGKHLSRLGFGAMRLPQRGHLPPETGRARRTVIRGTNLLLRHLHVPYRLSGIDFEAAGELIRRALARGINILDTAYAYRDSEEALGRAVAGLDRSSFHVQTKAPLRTSDGPGAVRRDLERSLERLRMDYVDFYLAHDARGETAGRPLRRFIEEARKAQSEGLVRHVGFSSHDTPAAVLRLIDTGEFECMLVQYNLLDTNYTVPIAHAHERGMGVMVMGPLAGGRLVAPTDLTRRLGGDQEQGVVPGLRFVFSNRSVNVALSGVSAIAQVDQNLEIASNVAPLSAEEEEAIERAAVANRGLLDLYCTGCAYCMPCPNGVNIPEILRLAQYVRLYDVLDYAREAYQVQLRAEQGVDRCLRCGECEPKCPQQLRIPHLLEECHRLLTGEDV